MQSKYTPDQQPRRSAAPFDALFWSVACRRDISAEAKLIHAKLVTLHRLRQSWTQDQIADALGLGSRQQVWRGLQDLIAADLVDVFRWGQGRPNSYVPKGIDADDLLLRADSIRARQRRIREERYRQLVALYGEVCLRCGTTVGLQIDHVVPRARGGPDRFSNLQLLCAPCNDSKGDTIADYRQSPGEALNRDTDHDPEDTGLTP